MKMKSIRRILSISLLTIGALASMAVHAVPPLPVFLVSPAEGQTVRYNDTFTWTPNGASKYIVKFKIVQTGQNLSYTFKGTSCGIDECAVTLHNTPLFNAVKDGQTVKWRVIAKSGTQKVKSVLRTVTVDTVNAPVTSPVNGSIIGNGDQLTWTNHPANKSYTLIVKHVASGTTVINETMLAGECVLLCTVEPHEAANLQAGQEYKWFVKAKGFNGNKAKSAKKTFTVPFAEIAQN